MNPTVAPFPATRLRRLRRTPAIRALVQENTLTPSDFIWPVFVRDGVDQVEPIASMPGVNRLSVDKVVDAAREARIAAHHIQPVYGVGLEPGPRQTERPGRGPGARPGQR